MVLFLGSIIDSRWFTHDRFGLFIHRGIYALPARHGLKDLGDRVEYAQLLNDASEVRMTVIDPHQGAQNTTMGGLAPNTLTLELSVQKPPVSVPVIELFLKG